MKAQSEIPEQFQRVNPRLQTSGLSSQQSGPGTGCIDKLPGPYGTLQFKILSTSRGRALSRGCSGKRNECKQENANKRRAGGKVFSHDQQPRTQMCET